MEKKQNYSHYISIAINVILFIIVGLISLNYSKDVDRMNRMESTIEQIRIDGTKTKEDVSYIKGYLDKLNK